MSALYEWLAQLARDSSLTGVTAYHDRITGDVLIQEARP